MKRGLRVFLTMAVVLGLGSSFLGAESEKTEAQKIETLIKQVEVLKDAKFVRNDTEYDAKTAATFLRRKWKSNERDVKTASDFVAKIASSSSTSGKPYLIRFNDGKEVKSRDWLMAELKKLENPKQEQP